MYWVQLLKLLYLPLMLCCSELPMNWFINGEVMEEKKNGFLGGWNNNNHCFKLWESLLSGKIIHHYCHFFGAKKVRGTWWRKLLYMWVFGWFIGSMWIFWYMNSHAMEKRRETLANMCDERARMLQDQFNVSMNHVQALSILVSTFHHGKHPSAIDQRTFAKYTERTAFERPLTSGVAYAVRVLHSEREQFERQQGWTIKRLDSEDQSPGRDEESIVESPETSPVEEEYAPVIFAQDTISHVVSFDMLTGKEDRDNVLRARKSGQGVLTAPFRLLKSKRLGVILTFAVYKIDLPSNATPDERIQATNGYLGGVFDVESLVDKLLHQLACKQSIIVNVYDTTNPSDPISMYGSNVTGNGIFHVSPLNFGDPMRKHEMHCRFKHKPPWPWLAITTSIGALVIALLVGYIFHATVNRINKVEDDFREMMELKRRAEEADVAKSQFLATVSHEIRTPMNGVLGMLQMLMDTDLDVTQQDYVRTAQASGKALVSLINEVLDQAKIESGKLELEAVCFDLRAVLDDILSLFSGKSQDKGIELAVYVSDQVPETLIGDPGRIRQIIMNLIGNSIKFTEKGHIFVTVHLVEEVMNSQIDSEFLSVKTLSGAPVVDRRRSWESFKAFSQDGPTFHNSLSSSVSDPINLIISVEDTGVGIPQESQSRVFTPFMQVRPSISRIHGGTGIGLSISKCLVSLMKGEIAFASEPQIGSTFSFIAVLMRARVDTKVSKDQHHQQINSHLDSLSSVFHGMKALVIDPIPVRAKVSRYHLQRLGIHVEMVCDLNEALSRGLTNIDIALANKDDWSKDSHLWPIFVNKSKESRPALPKLFIIANPSGHTRPTVSGANGYEPIVIMKPLRANMLSASLQRAIGVTNKEGGNNGGLPLLNLKTLLLGKQILVVDDNAVNLRVAAGALKKYGAQVACAESGKKAVAMLKPPHKFDACFMDIQMPEMDGFEATKRIRDMEDDANERIRRGETSSYNVTHWHTPILAMTADVIQATYEECLRCGMDGYVSKPFDGEQLYREVARFLKATKLQ
ncbi:Histidine kinase 3 [Acorus calamus]|uniref:histidine kinase n=1 Tax=Acorus calamus TaxID=4465 RepID=A0AAV9EZQ7_ACOCL|nr:Histidine kinase 3 [Acorus calamus]